MSGAIATSRRCGTAKFAAAVLLAAAAAGADTFSVDLMLRSEAVGKVLLDPAGSILLFERFGPYEAQQDFAQQAERGQYRSKIFALDLLGNDGAVPLFPQAAADGYTLGELSPDGSHLSYYRLSAGRLHAGVFSFRGAQPAGKTQEFEFVAQRGFEASLPWLPGNRLIHPIRSGAAAGYVDVTPPTSDDLLHSQWLLARAGRTATASALQSGRYLRRGIQPAIGHLVTVAVADGTPRTIGTGNFEHWSVAPGGRRIAAIRTRPLAPDPENPLEHATAGGVLRELVLLQSDGNGEEVLPCPRCDVIRHGMNWSADGRSLVFFAREQGRDWQSASFWRYDVQGQKLASVELGDLAPAVRRGSFDLNLDPRALWLGNELLVYARPQASVPGAGAASAAWYRVDDCGNVRSLPLDFGEQAAHIVGVFDDALLLWSAGEIWQQYSDGRRQLLTGEVEAAVSVWHGPGGAGHASSHAAVNRVDSLVLVSEAGGGDADGVAQLLLLDLASAEIDVLAPTPLDARTVAVSHAAGQVVSESRQDHAIVLSATNRQGDTRELLRLNEHLSGLASSRYQRLDHELPDGSAVHSWLLLPPGYRDGEPLPTIARIYPGQIGGREAPGGDPYHFSALNPQILAAMGFAVLFPSLPATYYEVPRDPLKGLAGDVLAAVDAAVAAGYADPGRLGVFGHSYGAYAAMAVIGQTGRFRAAVASAGIYDLASVYGSFDAQRRLAFEVTGPNLFWASWSETSQGGMGAPPWHDLERYRRNSPLYQVESISTPVMLVHGDRDFVPMNQAEQMFTALLRLDKDAVFLRYWGEGHVLASPANIRDLWRRVGEWYGRNLASDRSAAPP